jgi:aarF domain-containing kinase
VANRILKLSIANKGIYLKLGQYLGNLDRVIPWEFVEVLKVLQDSGPSVPYDEIKVVIEEDLNQKPKDIFQTFSKEPFAAASLAQVHRATLKSGEEVAVKIQFPFLRAQSKWDLWVLERITSFCDYLMIKNNFKDVNLVTIFTNWTQTLVEELDFEREIANAEHTAILFKHHPSLYIPKMHSEFSSRRLIVMEYIDGVKINEVEKLKSMGFDTKEIGSTLISIFSEMIFKHGFVHCDAHPGNILVRKHKDTNRFQIVLLDHGLYHVLDPAFIRTFSELWLALVKLDRAGLQQVALKLNIQSHYEYLPIIFLRRTVSSAKRMGEDITS